MKLKKISSTKNRLPLRFKVWIYFVLFTLMVFLLLWVCQIFFLENFYERMKVRGTSACAAQITEAYTNIMDKDFYDEVWEIAQKNDFCVEILDRHCRSRYSAEVLGDCIIHGLSLIHISEPTRLLSISYAVFCLKKKNKKNKKK